MKADDITGLTAEQIKDKFALQIYRSTYVMLKLEQAQKCIVE
jgi:hypothetical protein